MAIYKLGDIAFVTKLSGFEYTKYFSDKSKFGEIPLIQSNNIKFNSISYDNMYYTTNEISSKLIRSKPVDGDVLLSYVGTIGENYLVTDKDNIHLGSNVAIIRLNKTSCIPKYFQLWLKTDYFEHEKIKYVKGAVQQNISMSDIRKFSLDLPDVLIQQEIIDIIEPFEEIIDHLKVISYKIEELEKKLMNFSSITDTPFSFIKGEHPSKESGETLFLNVAAANGNPNRYVKNSPNVFMGDVTVSLDGNCGLVNNTLEGFNGYLYKVKCADVQEWQIFYSLLTVHSQKLIKLNETGTTIKHASGAKKELKLFKFEHEAYLKSLFDFRISIYKLSKKSEKIRQNLIALLIK